MDRNIRLDKSRVPGKSRRYKSRRSWNDGDGGAGKSIFKEGEHVAANPNAESDSEWAIGQVDVSFEVDDIFDMVDDRNYQTRVGDFANKIRPQIE